jgi:hypothetical protein
MAVGIMGARSRPGGRGAAATRRGVEESPDSIGQDAGEIPGGATRGTVQQKANRPGIFPG